jgi:hypothetical protein
MIFFHAIANAAATSQNLFPFMFYLKFLELLFLYGLSFFIKQHANEESQLLFLSSPITYLVILFHGQIDVILLFFLIGSLMTLNASTRAYSTVTAGLLYATSIAVKTWSVIFLPLIYRFFGFRKTTVILLTTLLFLFADIFVYTRMVFNGAFRVVIPALTEPGGPVGIWGISILLKPIADHVEEYNIYIFALLMALGWIIIARRNIGVWTTSVALILWVYLIIPNWGVQYLFWVLPFSYLIKKVNCGLAIVTSPGYI